MATKIAVVMVQGDHLQQGTNCVLTGHTSISSIYGQYNLCLDKSLIHAIRVVSSMYRIVQNFDGRKY